MSFNIFLIKKKMKYIYLWAGILNKNYFDQTLFSVKRDGLDELL